MENLDYDDRIIDSTENNEYNEGLRDENLIEENLIDVDIPEDDLIANEARREKEDNRPLYSEDGLREL